MATLEDQDPISVLDNTCSRRSSFGELELWMVLEVIHGTSEDLHQLTKRSCFNVTEATGDLCRVKSGRW